MNIRNEIEIDEPLTDEQMLEALKSKPVQPTNDCLELTTEQLNQIVKVSETRRNERRKQNVTLRLSPQALKTAKSLGKGYTSVLSRILENALTDIELIKRYL